MPVQMGEIVYLQALLLWGVVKGLAPEQEGLWAQPKSDQPPHLPVGLGLEGVLEEKAVAVLVGQEVPTLVLLVEVVGQGYSLPFLVHRLATVLEEMGPTQEPKMPAQTEPPIVETEEGPVGPHLVIRQGGVMVEAVL
jgi:hypothetical protein